MADTKISALTALTGASVATDDVLPIIDTSAAASGSKKITIDEFNNYLETLYQGLDSELTAIAGLTSAADRLPYFTGSGTASLATFTSAGRAVLDDADAAAQRVTLGVSVAAIHCTINGGGSAITAGKKAQVSVPFGCTITGWTAIADQSGSISVQVNKSTYANFPTTSSIVASAPIALSSVQKNTDSTLTGWTTAVSADDIVEFEVTGTPSSITRLQIIIEVTR
jgi:hypothetical protein